MKFNYKKYSSSVLRPVIPIKLKNKDLEIGYEVLVDSGADFCVFDAQVGEAIGIDVKKGKPPKGGFCFYCTLKTTSPSKNILTQCIQSI